MQLIGISGPSCSGKSTLARHLRLILPNAGILYEDDFYLPESQLPLDEFGGPNWDCPRSFDLAKLRSTLATLKASKSLPEQNTREDKNNVASAMLAPNEIEELRQKYAHFTQPILLIDGIILFHPEVNIDPYLTLKLLVPFDYDSLKIRREARCTYETPDGQWSDPPHFFENIVWPEFVRHCANLYVADGHHYVQLSPAAERAGIKLTPNTEDMSVIITAVMDELSQKLSQKA